MMRERLLSLRERRAVLIGRIETQRGQVFRLVDKADRVTAWVDRARAIGRRVRAHPLWVAGGVALLVALRPRQVGKLLVPGLSLWRGWRTVRAMIDRFVPAQPRARRAY